MKNFVLADHLQGSEGALHPKTLPYNQGTGGSHNSSDRGSNSTSGEAGSSSGSSSRAF